MSKLLGIGLKHLSVAFSVYFHERNTLLGKTPNEEYSGKLHCNL